MRNRKSFFTTLLGLSRVSEAIVDGTIVRKWCARRDLEMRFGALSLSRRRATGFSARTIVDLSVFMVGLPPEEKSDYLKYLAGRAVLSKVASGDIHESASGCDSEQLSRVV